MAQYFTKEGLEKLKKELEDLRTVEVKKATKLIAEAAAFGDLKENSAYHDARDKKSFLLGRIAQLESAINEAVVVDRGVADQVKIGSEVTILFADQEEQYQIVAPTEANILQKKISYQSPLGEKLMGKKLGEEFPYQVKERKVKIKVLKIN